MRTIASFIFVWWLLLHLDWKWKSKAMIFLQSTFWCIFHHTWRSFCRLSSLTHRSGCACGSVLVIHVTGAPATPGISLWKLLNKRCSEWRKRWTHFGFLHLLLYVRVWVLHFQFIYLKVVVFIVWKFLCFKDILFKLSMKYLYTQNVFHYKNKKKCSK